MMNIYQIRSEINAFYQKFQIIINTVAKFIVSFIAFSLVNKAIGYDSRFAQFPVTALLSLLCAFTPSSVLVLMIMVLSLVHVYFASKFLAIIVAVIFVILYCLFFRFVPQYGTAVAALPICWYIGLPYAVPLILGIMASPISIFSIICGVISYKMFKIINIEAVAPTESLNDALALYIRVVEKLVKDKEMYALIVIFSLVIVICYVVRKLKIKYAFEISIAAGMIFSLVGCVIVNTKFSEQKAVGKIIFMNILCAAIAFIVQFFKRVLNYKAVENVQFEDDDYYYYVKAVPKIEPQIQNGRENAYYDDLEEEPLEEYNEETEEAEIKNISIVERANARKREREVYKREESVDFTVDTSGIDIDDEINK